MDPGGYGGAFGGSKAGGQQDPLTFLKKPNVVMRLSALIFATVVFGSISSQGWTYDDTLHKDVCIMNNQSATCHFSTFVGVVGFVASIAFLVGEWFFEQMSSIKTRKHFVIADMVFSSLWAFFYLVACLIMSVAWSKSDEKYDYGSTNILGAIFFALLSVFSWVGINMALLAVNRGGGAFFAYQRFKAGSDGAFAEGIDDEEGEAPDGAYQGYGTEEGQYSEPPFSGGGQTGMNYQQQVQY
ncbi:hypothetical protein TCAL_04677 [Tigriopus californicus]|uniref:Synaptogyrin n=1 Tax=Tigriopus californicus TaxID=6832 RepID=A0A553NTX9_TIGCA|nr:hypothetical protein TCAL_04677 [Tigriopus californicus]